MLRESSHKQETSQTKAVAHQMDKEGRSGSSMGAVSVFSGFSSPPPLANSRLAIQRAVPVRLGKSGLIQRATTPTSPDYRSRNQIASMTVKQFDEYANNQADWHASTKLTDDQRSKLRKILAFGRKGYLGACAGLHVWRMLSAMLTFGEAEYLTQLEHYAQAVSNNEPINLKPITDSYKAYRIGKDLGKLKDAFPHWVLRTALTEEYLGWLRESPSLIQDVIQYYQTSTPQPIFQAQNGMDFDSYYRLKKEDNDNPLAYHGGALKGKIRNFHRFSKKALRRLQTNFGKTANTKPLTLILHTSLDHNGAFHRDPNLDAVITNNHMLTLMLEGFESLSDMKSQIEPIAKQYGKNDKIDQVMVAGHGNANSMQLTGTIEEDPDKHTIKEKNDGLGTNWDLSTHPKWPTMSKDKQQKAQKRIDDKAAKTKDFFEEILNNMDMNPANPGKRRILLNACLTGSNAVKQALDSKDVSKAQKEIKSFIQTNPSLMTMVQNQANAKATGAVKVLGANASFGSEAKLIDPNTHELDLKSPEDPKLTAPKIQYVEHGNEPTGALRAVLESWAHDKPATLDAMRRKIAAVASSTDFEQVVIRTCYQIILDKYKDNADMIRQVGDHGGHLGHIHPWLHIKRRKMKGFDAFGADAIKMLQAVQTSDMWSNDDKVPLSLYHAWMTLDSGNAALKTQFLAHLDSKFTVRTAREVVDIAYLESKGHLATLLQGSASNAKLKLALLGVANKDKPVNALCKTYLESQVDTTTKKFPGSLNVSAALGGASDERTILQRIGLGAPAPSSATKANLKLEGESQNTIHVKSMTEKKLVFGSGYGKSVTVYTRPDTSSTAAGTLGDVSEINVIGEINGWYAIEHHYTSPDHWGTAFIQKSSTI